MDQDKYKAFCTTLAQNQGWGDLGSLVTRFAFKVRVLAAHFREKHSAYQELADKSSALLMSERLQVEGKLQDAQHEADKKLATKARSCATRSLALGHLCLLERRCQLCCLHFSHTLLALQPLRF